MDSTRKRLRLSAEDIAYMYDLPVDEINEQVLQFALREILKEDRKVEDTLSMVRMELYPFRQTVSEQKAEQRKRQKQLKLATPSLEQISN